MRKTINSSYENINATTSIFSHLKNYIYFAIQSCTDFHCVFNEEETNQDVHSLYCEKKTN